MIYFILKSNPNALWCINWGKEGGGEGGLHVFLFLAETQHMYTYALKLNKFKSLTFIFIEAYIKGRYIL